MVNTNFKVTYREAPKGTVLVEVTKNLTTIRELLDTRDIWRITAHIQAVLDELD